MFPEYKSLNLVEIGQEVLEFWKKEDIFQKSISHRQGALPFVFYEGPPSANGMPGIHHVLGRTIKDLFCRYKTLKGFQVSRKSGWDTHGLPVELQVEKRLGIRKEDIGVKISIAEYNEQCRKDVMQYQSVWENLTEKLGYWVDLQHPYITYESAYIETLWNLLKRFFDRGLLYKGYTIQPYSPAAGTGLSSHELNQPGTYKTVKDITCVAQFKVIGEENAYFLAWTTTPWTLPSNTALAVGATIDYVLIDTLNPYTHERMKAYLAKDTLYNFFAPDADRLDFEIGSKKIPFRLLEHYKGVDLEGMRYEQLMPYVQPQGDAFRVVIGDFVTTDEGTGIVHIAPTFGADDMRVAQKNNIPALTVPDVEGLGKQIPLVDRTGKFVPQVSDFAGRYVKDYTSDANYTDVNIDIVVKLKKEGKCFRSEKYEHSYPHCWRTDKPILYYPMESWFIRTTAFKEKLINHNNDVHWKPAGTGSGRFGNWLENLVDWNLSRTRFWGTPLPIWITENEEEILCIGSFEQLREEVSKAVKAGLMATQLSADFDPHRPYVDEIILLSPGGRPMRRVPDVVDVWFDSGAMPYAQWHFPFENKELFDRYFPADFIAEGVDQTRGWFFTLHALAVMLFDSIAFKNVVSNGLILDKNGAKMSKRIGNVVDPFETLEKYGADATRWYMLYNSPPWENLKFDSEGIAEAQKKFFSTLFNVYSFFALYANIDGFHLAGPPAVRSELDRWILSLKNTLILEVQEAMDDYEPTRAVRAIQNFVTEDLSNWYVRLSRRRFWKGEYGEDKLAAYQTLYECLETLSILISPFAPFYADRLFRDIHQGAEETQTPSVHLADFPTAQMETVDKDLEEKMHIAQQLSSLVLSLRKKAKIRVRQPLQRIIVPALDSTLKEHIEAVKELVLAEVNVKELEFISDEAGILKKKIKPDFKMLGPKYGSRMKKIQEAIANMKQGDITDLEANGYYNLCVENDSLVITKGEVEILSEDIPGLIAAYEGKLAVALDIQLTESLLNEGLARELVSKIQQMRKAKGFNVTDHISVEIEKLPAVENAVYQFKAYLCSEILADEFLLVENSDENSEIVEVEDLSIAIAIKKQ